MNRIDIPRRQFLQQIGAAVAGAACASSLLAADVTSSRDDHPKGDKKMPFTLPPLPYDYNALEPHIDEMTMRIHHDKHHGAYVDNLNKALEKYPDWQSKSLEDILKNIAKVPEDVRTAVNNNGGGHSNHSIFWTLMAPAGKGGGEPTGELASAITGTFGDFAKFKTAINDAGLKRFGSGWSWLCFGPGGKLIVESFANQDSPYSKGYTPILGVDVWEHAYYLKYQNRRADYLNAWWSVVNWTEVAARFKKGPA